MVKDGWHSSYGYGLYVENNMVTALDKKDPSSFSGARIPAKLWVSSPTGGYISVASGTYTLRQVRDGICRRRFKVM